MYTSERMTSSNAVVEQISKQCGLVVQLVRMPACHAGGRRFEPVPGRQFFLKSLLYADEYAKIFIANVEHISMTANCIILASSHIIYMRRNFP